jgi:hypothetical protein
VNAIPKRNPRSERSEIDEEETKKLKKRKKKSKLISGNFLLLCLSQFVFSLFVKVYVLFLFVEVALLLCADLLFPPFSLNDSILFTHVIFFFLIER